MSFSILTESPPIVVAHRGSSRKYPENTLCAFEAALSQGARWIETDITLTQDKFPVVIHDDTVDRTTNGSGNVKDLTLSEIQTFDAGSWFDPRFSNQAIPTLEQLLDLFGNRCKMNLEIKALYGNQTYVEEIVGKVMDMVLRKKLGQSILISSFDPAIIEALVQQYPGSFGALLSEKPLEDAQLEYIEKLGLFSFHQRHDLIRLQDVERLHERKVKLFAYTVNSHQDYIRLSRMGVDGFFTDDVSILH